MFGLKDQCFLDIPEDYYTLESYEGGEPRWCPGCGDWAILTAMQKVCRDAQIPPEKIVSVSGIGCSSRLPHYMSTYGFHSLHGRALPVACGIKARRPDLTVWVSTGDGDNCSIGAGHWLHAIRYNMDITVVMFDNHIYGLTKKQTSPTSPMGTKSNTHPRGSWLPPLNPLSNMLGFTNVSFLAQTVDWNPVHLQATLQKAFEHRGTSFVVVMQRCPTYLKVFEQLTEDPNRTTLLTHPDGIVVDDAVAKIYGNQLEHDPRDLAAAREIADSDMAPIGLLFQDETRPVYDDFAHLGMKMSVEEKIRGLNQELDRFAL